MELGFEDESEEEVVFPEYEGTWHEREYLRDTWMDKRSHGIFPREGSYHAQDPKWVRDVRWINARYNAWFEWWLREKKTREKKGERDAFPTLMKQGGGAVGWDELMRG